MGISSLIKDKGWFRTAGKLLNRAIRFNSPIAVQVGDFDLYAKTLDRFIALILLKFKKNEMFETELFKTSLKPGMRVIDAGANLGYYTLIAAKVVGAAGQVYAFEPDEENFYLLGLAVEKSKLRNIRVFKKALSSKSGKGALYFCEEHRGDHRIFDDGTGRKKIEIEIVALDDVIPPGTKVDFIKIDIQGAEAAAQAGMNRVLRESPDIKIISEFWPHGLLKACVEPKVFLQSWIDLGFKISLIDNSLTRLEKISIDEFIRRFTGVEYGSIFLSRG